VWEGSALNLFSEKLRTIKKTLLFFRHEWCFSQKNRFVFVVGKRFSGRVRVRTSASINGLRLNGGAADDRQRARRFPIRVFGR
jgi:hypothetical protein